MPIQFVSIIIVCMETEVREKEFSGKMTLLDKYILKQIIEMLAELMEYQKGEPLPPIILTELKRLKFYKNHDLIYKLCYYEFD